MRFVCLIVTATLCGVVNNFVGLAMGSPATEYPTQMQPEIDSAAEGLTAVKRISYSRTELLSLRSPPFKLSDETHLTIQGCGIRRKEEVGELVGTLRERFQLGLYHIDQQFNGLSAIKEHVQM